MLLRFELLDDGGYPQLHCRLGHADLPAASAVLADGIARRRIGNERLYKHWRSRHLDYTSEPLPERDLLILKAGLLQNIGTPADPAHSNHLHGLVAEAIWYEVVSSVDAGLGLPSHIEGHDWSVTDPGGDGLSVYETVEGGHCFRLWESKYHGASAPVRETVNRACQQVTSRSLEYLTRFSLIAQRTTDDEELARFYGSLADLWVDRDPAAGVGISISTSDNSDAEGCFGKVTTYFQLQASQHQAHLHLMADFKEFARLVRTRVWKGCGLWTEP